MSNLIRTYGIYSTMRVRNMLPISVLYTEYTPQKKYHYFFEKRDVAIMEISILFRTMKWHCV